jgi:acetyltransferase
MAGSKVLASNHSWRMSDGTEVVIRPIRSEDEAAMVEFHQGLSPHSVYLRYFYASPLSQRVAHDSLTRACENSESNTALVAETCDTQGILAVARLVRISSNEAEVSVIVRDKSQHFGLGTELVRRMLRVAVERAISRITMYVLRENIEMEDLATRLGFVATGNDDPQVIHYVRDLRPSELIAYYGARRSRVRSHPDQQSEVMPITSPD